MGERTQAKNLAAVSPFALLLVGLIVGLGLSSIASAANLVPGAAPVAVQPTNSAAGANLLITSGAVPFLGFPHGKFSGTLTTDVYNNDPSNPYGFNALTFTFLVVNNGTSTNSLHRFVASDFTGFTEDDAGYNPFTGGVVPATMDLSAETDGVGFNFPTNTISPGTQSALLVIHTNATAYTDAIDSLIDTDTGTAASYGPTTVPEPATIGLLALAGVTTLRRRR